MTSKNLTKMLTAVLLATAALAHADDAPIRIAVEEGKAVAQFNVGDSRCMLKNDQIRCTPVTK